MRLFAPIASFSVFEIQLLEDGIFLFSNLSQHILPHLEVHTYPPGFLESLSKTG